MEQRSEGVGTSLPDVVVLAQISEQEVVAQHEPAGWPINPVLERWLPLIYILVETIAELAFIECYCHWHGAQFLLWNPLKLYSADNIHKLSQIGFVGDSFSVMSFTAEILMWASLGVWSARVAGMLNRYKKRRPNPPYDLTEYIGVLGCHTSIAAAIMIILKLANFKVFNISLDSFEATTGTAFILGYFGNHTERLLNQVWGQMFSKKSLTDSESADQ
jgi:hypothetical protein